MSAAITGSLVLLATARSQRHETAAWLREKRWELAIMISEAFDRERTKVFEFGKAVHLHTSLHRDQDEVEREIFDLRHRLEVLGEEHSADALELETQLTLKRSQRESIRVRMGEAHDFLRATGMQLRTIKSEFSRFPIGEALLLDVDLRRKLENARESLEIVRIAFWPDEFIIDSDRVEEIDRAIDAHSDWLATAILALRLELLAPPPRLTGLRRKLLQFDTRRNHALGGSKAPKRTD